MNAQVVARARVDVEATDEIQIPPQIRPHNAQHLCADCTGTGRSHTIIVGGTAVEIWPKEKFRQLREQLEQPTNDGDRS